MSPRTFLLPTALLLTLAGCGAAPAPTPATSPASSLIRGDVKVTVIPPSGAVVSVVPSASSVPTPPPPSSMQHTTATATIETSKGAIVVRFFPEKAPKHVANFIALAKRGAYDGTRFHRVIPDFMIQGGDLLTKDPATPRELMGTGSAKDEQGNEIRIPAEFNDTSHVRGILSMARSADPNSASSQFFIVVKDSTFLDRNYTAFGEVVSGMDVADAIVSVPRDDRDNPLDPVVITKVTVSEQG